MAKSFSLITTKSPSERATSQVTPVFGWSNGWLRQPWIGPSVFKTKAARQRHWYVRRCDILSFVYLLVLSVSICWLSVFDLMDVYAILIHLDHRTLSRLPEASCLHDATATLVERQRPRRDSNVRSALDLVEPGPRMQTGDESIHM